jgi:hypothetical protein
MLFFKGENNVYTFPSRNPSEMFKSFIRQRDLVLFQLGENAYTRRTLIYRLF